MEHRNHSDHIANINVIMQQELNALSARIAELERELEQQQQQQQQQRISHKDWIRDNLEEAQQIIDNIVGIKGITEDPLKVAAELEALVKLTPAYRYNKRIHELWMECHRRKHRSNT